MGNDPIKKVEEEKDLGVIIQNNLSPDKHISKISRDIQASYKH